MNFYRTTSVSLVLLLGIGSIRAADAAVKIPMKYEGGSINLEGVTGLKAVNADIAGPGGTSK